jgi:GNAT superfamily N-acetyltransferase
MVKPTIREAVRRDLPALVALWQEMMDYHRGYDPRFRFGPNAQREVERHLLETMRSRAARILVADTDGRVVGYILGEVHARRPLYPVGNYGFISDISVTASFRRMGIGRALVGAMDAWFASQKVTTVELFAATLNPESAAFWLSLGYTDYLRLMRRDL